MSFLADAPPAASTVPAPTTAPVPVTALVADATPRPDVALVAGASLVPAAALLRDAELQPAAARLPAVTGAAPVAERDRRPGGARTGTADRLWRPAELAGRLCELAVRPAREPSDPGLHADPLLSTGRRAGRLGHRFPRHLLSTRRRPQRGRSGGPAGRYRPRSGSGAESRRAPYPVRRLRTDRAGAGHSPGCSGGVPGHAWHVWRGATIPPCCVSLPPALNPRLTLGSLVALRGHGFRTATAHPGYFRCGIRVVKDRRRGPGGALAATYHAPYGMC